MFRRPYARIDVVLLAAGRAAVRVDFPAGGTGRGEPADRLDVVLGLLAWTMHRTHESRGPAVSDSIRVLASAVADSADGSLPAGTVRGASRSQGQMDVVLENWPSGRGGAYVRLDLVPSAVGPVPVLRGSPAPAILGIAALAAGAWDCAVEDLHGRLALALCMEGIVAWYGEAHRMSPPRDAVEFARTHALDRLVMAGRAIPAPLAGTPEQDADPV
ncbi:MAG: hypothetical protein EXQ74_04940 [Thermoleophilia bacterium]|nr:hypothetical protein [Thermoleophilia bacterium]